MASDNSRKRVPQRYGDMPDKWDDWHVRLPDPKDQLRVIDLNRSLSITLADMRTSVILEKESTIL